MTSLASQTDFGKHLAQYDLNDSSWAPDQEAKEVKRCALRWTLS